MKTTHQAVVVPVVLEPHSNADALSIVSLFDGAYQIVGRTESWQGVTKAVFIPPENLVDTTRDEFSFLHKKEQWEKVKVVRLRGEISQGLLVPAKPEWEIGQDVTKELDVRHWDDEEVAEAKADGVDNEPSSFKFCPVTKYDVDGPKELKCYFVKGEEVIYSSKLHGTNIRFVYDSEDDKFYVGSRSNWWQEKENNLYWQGFHSNPEIAEFLKIHPNQVLRGELVGKQKGYKYGLEDGKIEVYMFDLMDNKHKYVDFSELETLLKYYNIKMVPIIETGPYSHDKVVELSDGPSLVDGANHNREGCVVRPINERRTPKGNHRVMYKVIGASYYNKGS